MRQWQRDDFTVKIQNPYLRRRRWRYYNNIITVMSLVCVIYESEYAPAEMSYLGVKDKLISITG